MSSGRPITERGHTTPAKATRLLAATLYRKKRTMEDKDFLATARKRFAAAAEDEKHLRDKFVSDLKFASPDGDDQWDPLVKMQREQAGRPAMSFPRCHTFVQQVS